VTASGLLHEKQGNEKQANEKSGFIYTKNHRRYFVDGRILRRRRFRTAEYER
jgi:hypothetical protein